MEGSKLFGDIMRNYCIYLLNIYAKAARFHKFFDEIRKTFPFRLINIKARHSAIAAVGKFKWAFDDLFGKDSGARVRYDVEVRSLWLSI